MPYKARLGSGEPRKREKPQYRVANACEYNRSLKRRGQLSLYFPRGGLRALFINSTPWVRGVAGREPHYTSAYIESSQTTGYRVSVCARSRASWKTNARAAG
ncbi:hypothetical protein [Paraburkholderia fungorum]|uniref:hypothetical protein n=1 Tax=Paraburkholderia fungorum TaxID=134537 RepID=UPI0038BA7B82